MAYRYVQLITGNHSLSLATDGRTAQESMDKAARSYPTFKPTFCADLSESIAERFHRVEKSEQEITFITVDRLRRVIGELLWEGRRIIDEHLKGELMPSVLLKVQFEDVPYDHIPLLLEHEPTTINNRRSYEFYREEAIEFMATIIREGMAQRMKEVIAPN